MRFFPFLKTKGFVGIDLGSYAIKVAEIISEPEGPTLRSFGQARLPVGCILGGVLKDPDLVAEKLKSLIHNLKPHSEKAVISLSSYTAITKRLTIDLSDEKNIEECIYEEAEALIPFNLEDVYLDYQIISESENRIEAILVAARKEIIEETIDLIQKVGLRPFIIDIDIIAISNLIEYIYDLQKNPTKALAIIDIGATKASVILWNKGSIFLTRDITFGAHEINEKIKETLKITIEEAERIKISGTFDGEQENIQKCFWEVYEKFSKEINNTIDYFYTSSEEELTIEKIILCGGGSQLPKIKEYLERNISSDIDFLSLSNKIIPDQKIEKEYIPFIEKVGTISLGLALREFIDA